MDGTDRAGGPLEEMFRTELRCPEAEARRLAAHAREFVARHVDAADDADEDLAFRLRDPRVFGAFADRRLHDSSVAHATRVALAEHAFDLLALPRTETDAFAVEARAPRRLLAIAAFLIEADAFTVLQALHVVYSVFLDRGLLTSVDRRVRSAVLTHFVQESGASAGLRSFYAGLHLAAVPEREAREEFEALLGSADTPASVKQDLVAMAVADDGGTSRLRDLAQQEGLLSPDLDEIDAPAILANVPRLPGSLAEAAQPWVGP